jgi:peptidoglycan pentaglycine glycine transferase (the first glycine)
MISAVEQKKLSLRELHATDRDRWQQFSQSANSCFMQSWVWADFKELEGYQTYRCGIFEQETLVGGCIFYFYPRPYSANLLVAPGGPFFAENYGADGLPLIIQKAEQLAKKLGAIALRIEPQWMEKPPHFESFVRAPVELLPSETLIVDLLPDPSEILTQMKPKGRYNIRVSQRHQVTTEFTTDAQKIGVFYDLFWASVERQHFFGESYRFFINLCQTLFANHMAELGFATWQGEILAGILLVYWGDRVTYLYGGRSDAHPQVMANYLLHWNAMQRAKSKGFKLYDFYGYTQNPNHGYAKFSQFKRQFGGTSSKTIGAHDYFFYNQFANTVIGLIQRTLSVPE